MKNIIKSILALTLITSAFVSCTDEQDLAYSQPAGSFAILSPQSGEGVTLVPETPLNPGLALTWAPMNYGTPTEVTYAVQIDKTGDDFDTPVTVLTTTSNFATISSETLNSSTLQLGLTPFTESAIDVRIMSTIGTTSSQLSYSDVITYLVTPYSTDLPKVYVVGSFLNASGYGNDWTPANAVPLAASAFGATDYEGFVYMNAASFEYKILPTNTSFDGDYGDDGSFSGSLVQTGESNCTGTGANYYRVKANTGSLTYSIEPASWGIIGFATTGSDAGWNNSTPLTYNTTTKKWQTIITLSSGDFKFRANNAWAMNLGGDSDADDSMNFDGPNLTNTAPGSYLVELNLSNPRKYSYTLTPQ